MLIKLFLILLLFLGNVAAVKYLSTLFAYSFYPHVKVTDSKYF